MNDLTKKELEVVKAVLSPFLQSDFFADADTLPVGVKSMSEANDLLMSAFRKLDKK